MEHAGTYIMFNGSEFIAHRDNETSEWRMCQMTTDHTGLTTTLTLVGKFAYVWEMREHVKAHYAKTSGPILTANFID